jgi:hypothetical protein
MQILYSSKAQFPFSSSKEEKNAVHRENQGKIVCFITRVRRYMNVEGSVITPVPCHLFSFYSGYKLKQKGSGIDGTAVTREKLKLRVQGTETYRNKAPFQLLHSTKSTNSCDTICLVSMYSIPCLCLLTVCFCFPPILFFF